MELAGHVTTQIFQHDIERLIEHSSRGLARVIIVIILKFRVLNYHERRWRLHKTLTGSRKFQQTVVFHILFNITGDNRLAHDRTPQLGRLVFSFSELLKRFMAMRHYIIGSTALNKVNDVLGSEILFQSMNGSQNDKQCVTGLYPLLGMQAVIAIMTIIL